MSDDGDSRLRPALVSAGVVCAVVALDAQHEIVRIIKGVEGGGETHNAGILWNVLSVHKASKVFVAWDQATEMNLHSWLKWLFLFRIAVCVVLIGTAAIGIARFGQIDRPQGMANGRVAAVAVVWVMQLAVEGVFVLTRLRPFWALMSTTYLAWGVTAVALGWAVYTGIVRSDARRKALRGVIHALGVQRFQVGVVALLTVLFVVPGPPILEQGTDVLRSWVLSFRATSLWGLLAFVLLALVLRYLGGVRAAARHVGSDGAVDAPYTSPTVTAQLVASGRGLLIAIGLVPVYFILRSITGLIRTDGRVSIFTLIIVGAVPIAGLLLVKVTPVQRDSIAETKAARRRALMTARLLAVSVPVVLFVSISRATIGPMLLTEHDVGQSLVAFFVSGVIACTIFGISVYIAPPEPRDGPSDTLPKLARLDPQLVGAQTEPEADGVPAGAEPPPSGPKLPGRVISLAPSGGLTLILGLVLLLFPVTLARLFGVVGTVGLGLVELTLFFMTLMIASQIFEAPHAFRVFGWRRTPVIELMLVIALLTTLFATGRPLHEIRGGHAVPITDDRPTLRTAFDTWRTARSEGGKWPCATVATTGDVPGLRRVQPLVILAAEGGGIRAAWWTVDVMQALTATPCGAQTLFLTSGVSGGAVGLGLVSSVSPPATELAGGRETYPPYIAVTNMAKEDGLAAATSGLLTRDLFAGAFGLEFDAADVPDEISHFPDRAALMEDAWIQQIGQFGDPFAVGASPANVTWHTVFNGTSVAHDCRAMMSDVLLVPKDRRDATEMRQANSCRDPDNPIPGAYDLLTDSPCYVGLPTSTASLLAARFPYVTPSGVVTKTCHHDFADQVIDGGYAENTGIDTANSVLAQLMPWIRNVNAAALAAGGDGTVIVPAIVFAHNTVAASSPSTLEKANSSPESAIPVLNSGAGKALGEPTTLLERSAVIAGDWMPFIAPGTSARGAETTEAAQAAVGAAVGTVMPDLVMTVAPHEKAQMALPLGWALSTATERTLDDALDDYLACSAKEDAKCEASWAFDAFLVGLATASKD
ncbi:MAG: hypothetical protein JWN39_3343 [Ilumatobacteraceae bacterium]|nr:hypothetical protein [Ilumatobacteraceae bacterium]